ncbi:AI-2E family transporter [Carboxylicivirga sp. N1Y90]|uniref:AI-2E family transporter n=1 Tax=Carboxylicivirga fragile TaxID=3417571 RepID=UPI003D350749|nr:AI-2E family transporter [Marinilabiliaceae bacterium N1Y90]
MQSNLHRPYTFDRVVRMVIATLLIVGVLYAVNHLKHVLGPFVIALFIAYLLDPFVNFIQTKLRVKYRGVSVILAVAIVMSLISLVIVYLVPAFIQEMNKMGSLIKQYLQSVNVQNVLPFEMDKSLREMIREADLVSYLNLDNISQATKKIMPGFWNLFSGSMQILAWFIGLLVIVLYTIFILLDFKKMGEFWFQLIPKQYQEVSVGVVDDLAGAMDLYFRSQGLIALIVGILLAIGFKIIGLPMAIIMGLFIGALNIIPYLQIVGIIPALLLALLKAMETQQSFWHVALMVIIVIAIVQLIQETILTPRILGKAYGMNPAIVLLSLSIWGSLMGLLGMLLALPLTALIMSYYKRFALKQEVVVESVAEDDSLKKKEAK